MSRIDTALFLINDRSVKQTTYTRLISDHHQAVKLKKGENPPNMPDTSYKKHYTYDNRMINCKICCKKGENPPNMPDTPYNKRYTYDNRMINCKICCKLGPWPRSVIVFKHSTNDRASSFQSLAVDASAMQQIHYGRNCLLKFAIARRLPILRRTYDLLTI